MKTFLACIALMCISAPGFSQLALADQTSLKVILTKSLSSKTAQVGDIVYFRLAANLVVDSVVVIDTTAEVMGEIIEAMPARSLGRPGKLDFIISSVKATDGQNISLRATSKRNTGKDNTGGVVAAAVILTPVALLIKGKDVSLNAGKEFVVYVDRDYVVSRH